MLVFGKHKILEKLTVKDFVTHTCAKNKAGLRVKLRLLTSCLSERRRGS